MIGIKANDSIIGKAVAEKMVSIHWKSKNKS